MGTLSNPLVVLASASPRRHELLSQIGIAPRIWVSNVPEVPALSESPRDYTERIACTKAAAAALQFPAAVVIAADTAVALGDEIFGKPRDRAEASAMLRRLAGREHQVFSAVAVWREGRMLSAVSASRVRFCDLSESQIAAYCASGEPDDKAGSYGIQGLAAVFVEALNGSYSGVVGLPLFETAVLLRRHGVEILNPAGPQYV
ncbi:MAG: Maf family protein [Thiotrichales bacterium]